MRKNIKCKTQVINTGNPKGFTNKALNFHLPSSKQIIPFHSSKKLKGTKQDQNIFHQYNQSQVKKQFSQYSSSERQCENLIKEDQILEQSKNDKGFNRDCLEKKRQDFRIIPQSHKNILSQKIFVNRQLCSVILLPFQEEQKIQSNNQNKLTSINNILNPNENIQTPVKYKALIDLLTDRICKLQSLVADIMNGKISIPQAKPATGQQKQCKEKPEKVYPQSSQIINNKNRVKVQYKQRSKVSFLPQKQLKQNLAENHGKGKENIIQSVPVTTKVLKFDVEQSESKGRQKSQCSIKHLVQSQTKLGSITEQKKNGSKIKIPPNTNMFIMKKKATLKLTPNYHPLFEIAKKQLPELKIKTYINPLIPNEVNKNEMPLRLKLETRTNNI